MPQTATRSAARERELSPVSLCLARGPNGPPTYDKFGYKLDYHKIKAAQRRPKPLGGKSYQEYLAMLEQERRGEERKAEIMGGRRRTNGRRSR